MQKKTCGWPVEIKAGFDINTGTIKRGSAEDDKS